MASFSPLDWFRAASATPICRTALSSRPSLDEAVQDVVTSLGRHSEADLALVFVDTSYASDLPRLLPLLRQRLKASQWLGCAGGGVIGTTERGVATELEQTPALSVSLLNLPGAEIQTQALNTNALPDLDGPALRWQEWTGIDPDHCRSQIVLVDPTSSGINDLISGLDYAYPNAVRIGGTRHIDVEPSQRGGKGQPGGRRQRQIAAHRA